MYKNALAALPVLVVGLIFKEGVALVRGVKVQTTTVLNVVRRCGWSCQCQR